MTELDELMELHAANRRIPDPAAERKLVQLRAAAFGSVRQLKEYALPVTRPDGDCYGLPVIAAGDLSIGVLRQALGKYGALHVRGLLDARCIEMMRQVIDSALNAQEAANNEMGTEETRMWFDPSVPLSGLHARGFVATTGSVLAADSPRALFHLLDLFYDLGLDRLITDFLGERPALSVEKTTLRRVVPEAEPGGWHQDGRFLGTAIRSLNVWLALSDCGTDAPGLELVPKRLYRILETGTDDAQFDWIASHAMVEKQFPGAMIRPEFAAGDALLFDHFLMHRTFRAASMTKIRYAIESWFFAPSVYPESQTGFYV